MPFKGRFIATAAALCAFAALNGVHAEPASIGRALQRDTAAITWVGYDYPRNYGHRERFYYGDGPYREDGLYDGDGPLGLLEIPGKLLGGIAGLLTGTLGDPYNGDTYYGGSYEGGPYYSRPLYVSPYYGSPYRGADFGAYGASSYNNSPYNGGSYYSSPRYSRHGYRDYYGSYDDRRLISGREYRGEHDYSYDRHYGDAYYANGFSGKPYYADAYERPRPSYDADAYYAHRFNGNTCYGEAYDRCRASYDADDDDD